MSGESPADFPDSLSAPARRALAAAGYDDLYQLTGVSAPELLRLHGMGPKAVDQLRSALAERGWSFREA